MHGFHLHLMPVAGAPGEWNVKVVKRSVGDALIIDMFGAFPQEGTQKLLEWRDSLHEAVEGYSGPVILNIPDAQALAAVHVGILISGPLAKKRHDGSLAIVSKSKQLLDVLSVVGSLIPTYEREEDALRGA